MQKRKEVLLEHLEKEAGIQPLQDRYHAGYIAAINDLLNTEVEEIDTND